MTKGQRIFCEDQQAFSLTESINVNAGYKSVLAERGMGGPKREWLWSEVGPNEHPAEINPGGKAIPTYARERGNGTGRINYLYTDPYQEDRIFACSPTGGLFVSVDLGESWKNAGTDQLPICGVSSIVVDPENPDRWIISTGDSDDRFMFSDGIWRTEDAGQTWVNINGGVGRKKISPQEDPSDYLYITKLEAHPCYFGRIFAATNKGLFISNNALDEANKVKWKQVGESFFYDILIPDPDQPIVLATGEEFWRSDDCGNSWQLQNYPSYEDQERFPFSRICMVNRPTKGDVLFGLSCAQKFSQSGLGEGELWSYSPSDKKLTYMRSLRDAMNNLITTRGRALIVDPESEERIFTANVQPVFVSENNGELFRRIEKNQMHDDVHHFAWSNDGLILFVGHDGGVSKSFDRGATWQSANVGLGTANIFGLSVAQTQEHQVAYGGYDTGGNILIDGQWYHSTWGDGFETIIDYSDPKIMYTTKQHGHIHRSDDRGKSFENTVTSGKTKTDWHTWIRQHQRLPNVIFCTGDRLIRSYDKGENWDVILDVPGLEGDYLNVFRLFTSEDHPDVLYAYVLDQTKVDPILLMTTNAAEPDAAKVKWERVADVPKKGWITSLVVDPDNPRQFWMSYKSAEPEQKVYRFNGERYSDVTANLGWCVIGVMVLDRNSNERIYIGTNHGVFTRDKSEEQWTLLEGLPGTWVRALEINYHTNTIYAGTFGRGVWFAPLYQD
ncbi:MAG: hypothetical protein MK081_09885 [Flavobacteriales bacterium]|nr:hypothetical protein [Flavobacteriales bacterium]